MKYGSKFEGPEKKLEIVLDKELSSLRDNSTKKWDKVVEKSQAQIISHISNDRLDAYLLSESSLFVWNDRILMITCGDTILVDVIPEILSFIGETKYLLFYECRNFNFPHLQPSDFNKDSEKILTYVDGSTCKLGQTSSNHINIFNGGSSTKQNNDETDETLQILMDDLDPERLVFFSNENGNNVKDVIEKTKISSIYKDMKLDGYLFFPHGFSINGILDDRYFTIHVTPQKQFSYVSFETNFIEDNYSETINKIVSIFKPKHFSVILTTNRKDAKNILDKGKMDKISKEYIVTENETTSLNSGYQVLFRNHRKES
jgi:S-adenosylmethionine decarboxylase